MVLITSALMASTMMSFIVSCKAACPISAVPLSSIYFCMLVPKTESIVNS